MVLGSVMVRKTESQTEKDTNWNERIKKTEENA